MYATSRSKVALKTRSKASPGNWLTGSRSKDVKPKQQTFLSCSLQNNMKEHNISGPVVSTSPFTWKQRESNRPLPFKVNPCSALFCLSQHLKPEIKHLCSNAKLLKDVQCQGRIVVKSISYLPKGKLSNIRNISNLWNKI